MIGDTDRSLWDAGYVVVGVDECGRGPLAGPVSAGAVVMAGDLGIDGINDSKLVPPKRRSELSDVIRKNTACQVAHVSHTEIDEIGIKDATFKAMRLAVTNLIERWSRLVRGTHEIIVLVDGPFEVPDLGFKQRAIVHGDSLSLAVAAGSIVAKVERDGLMIAFDPQYPEYGFAQHKGYGTVQHLEALGRFGPCPIHRQSVRSVRKKEYHEAWLKARTTNAPWQELQKLGVFE